MKLKKTLAVFMSLAMLTGIAACSNKTETPAPSASEPAKATAAATAAPAAEGKKKIAVFYYQYNDTYISTVRSAFNDLAKADANLEIMEFDGQGDQAKQNDQIDTALAKGVDALLVNIVDTGAAQSVIDKVKASGKPVIFFNREPSDASVYASYDKSRFVGTKIEEAGVMEGELIKKFWEQGIHDRNGNGKLDYVLLHGGLDNAEAIARSEYAVKVLADAKIEVNKVAEQVANWDNEKAKQAMDAWLAKDKANIDVVIANNDGMAIGAMNACKAAGLNVFDMQKLKSENLTIQQAIEKDPKSYIGIFGVDATEEAKQAIKEGGMAGTVKQDNVAMATAMFSLGTNAANGKDFLDATQYKYDASGVAVRIPYQPYTGE